MALRKKLFLFQFIFTILAFSIEYTRGSLSPTNSSEGLPQLSLKNSKTISVAPGKESIRLQCPTFSTNSTSSQSIILLWLLPSRHVAVSESETSGVVNGTNKFRLIGSTGELEINVRKQFVICTIRLMNVSAEDGGIYRCVAKERRNQTCEYRTSGVNLIIETSSRKLVIAANNGGRKDYNDRGNGARAMAAAGGALFIFTILFTVHHFRWKKYDNPKLSHIHDASSHPGAATNTPESDSDDDDPIAQSKKPNPSESSNYAYVNQGFSMKTPSPDRIYVLPESTTTTRPSTSHPPSQDQTGSSLQTTQSSIGSGTIMLTVSSHPTNLKEDDIDGLSSRYPLHNPPFRWSSLQQSRREKRSQLRIKRWWLNPLPTGTVVAGSTSTPSNEGRNLSGSARLITPIPATCPVTMATPAKVDTNDPNDEDDVQRLQPHA